MALSGRLICTCFALNRRFTVGKLAGCSARLDRFQGFGAGFGHGGWGDVVLLGDRSGVAEWLGDVLGATAGAAHQGADRFAPDPRGDPAEARAVKGDP